MFLPSHSPVKPDCWAAVDSAVGCGLRDGGAFWGDGFVVAPCGASGQQRERSEHLPPPRGIFFPNFLAGCGGNFYLRQSLRKSRACRADAGAREPSIWC